MLNLLNNVIWTHFNPKNNDVIIAKCHLAKNRARLSWLLTQPIFLVPMTMIFQLIMKLLTDKASLRARGFTNNSLVSWRRCRQLQILPFSLSLFGEGSWLRVFCGWTKDKSGASGQVEAEHVLTSCFGIVHNGEMFLLGLQPAVPPIFQCIAV